MLRRLKWRIRRIWKGPGTVTHGSSQSDWTLMVASDGGLERKMKNITKAMWRLIKKLLRWLIAAIILAAIGFFLPYLLSQSFK